MSSSTIISILIVSAYFAITAITRKKPTVLPRENTSPDEHWLEDDEEMEDSEYSPYDRYDDTVNLPEISLQDAINKRTDMKGHAMAKDNINRSTVDMSAHSGKLSGSKTEASSLGAEMSDIGVYDSVEDSVMDDFDARKAIIYSEIMAPKYKSR